MRHLIIAISLALFAGPALAQDVMLQSTAKESVVQLQDQLPEGTKEEAVVVDQSAPDQGAPSEGTKGEAAPLGEPAPDKGSQLPTAGDDATGLRRPGGLGMRVMRECEEGFVRNEKGDCVRPEPSPTHGEALPAPAPEPEPEVAEAPCPEGSVRLSTGAECTPVGHDGRSPHDAVPVVRDSEGIPVRCPDFQVARRTEHGHACESSTIDCPEGQQARPTGSGWRCESPTIDCPEGQTPYALPNGWACR